MRDQTAELASWALLDPDSLRTGTSRHRRPDSLDYRASEGGRGQKNSNKSTEAAEDSMDNLNWAKHEAIQEVPEPISPAQRSTPSPTPPQSSALTDMLRKSPPQQPSQDQETQSPPELVMEDTETRSANEQTPLLFNSQANGRRPTYHSSKSDLEGQVKLKRRRLQDVIPNAKQHGLSAFRTATNPKLWAPHSIWQNAIRPAAKSIPSVTIGLLLNVLDALSYGFILFPLGSEIFSETGPDGIAIFYVSCIVSQLVYSCGGSIFKGGVGSEMVDNHSLWSTLN